MKKSPFTFTHLYSLVSYLYRLSLKDKVFSLQKDKKLFWSFIKSIVFKRKSNYTDISSNDWLNHFESLLNSESIINQVYLQFITDDFNLHNVQC